MQASFELEQLDEESLTKSEQIVEQIYADNLQEAYFDLLLLEEKYPQISDHIYEFARIKQDADDIQEGLDMLADNDTWEIVDDSEGIKTYSKGSGNEFFVKGEMHLHTPVFPILALFSEIDLIPTW